MVPPLHTVHSLLDRSDMQSRSQPKIGGSFAGFVAVVVVLILIIIASCTAVFLLLRDHEPSNRDREARRARYEATTSALGNTDEQYTYNPSSQPDQRSWIQRMFGRASKGVTNVATTSRNMTSSAGGGSGRTRRSSRGGHWQQAGSGDEWDTDSDHGDEESPRKSNSACAPLDTTFRAAHKQDSYPMSESRSAELHAVPGLAYSDPYNNTSSPAVSILPPSRSTPTSNQHESVSSFLPRQQPAKQSTADSANSIASSFFDPDDGVSVSGGRRFTTNAGGSMRTREGGTKFVEVLE